jgi:hypothetical protein
LRKMVDEEKRTLMFQGCFNQKREWFHYGYFPDFGDADRERVSVYQRASDDVSGYCEIPTLYVLNSTYTALHAAWKPQPWRELLKVLDYDEWVKEKTRELKIEIGNGFSLVNFLTEWKESLLLVKSWLSKEGLIRRWHRLTKANTVGQFARAAAQERLAHVYGTKLFLADAHRLWRILTGWRERVDRFLSQAGVPQRWYKHPRVYLPSLTSIGKFALPIFGIQESEIEILVSRRIEFRAELMYRYTIPQLKGYVGRIAQLCDAYGVKADAGIIWDAIPLTFIVDWFINVSQWLHANASYGNWNKIDLHIDCYGHSAKVIEGRVLRWHRIVPAPGGSVLSSDVIAEINYATYRRVPDLHPGFTKVALKLENPWKLDRVINAAALGITRGKYSGKQARKLRTIQIAP